MGGGKCNISLGTSGTVFITSDTFGVDKQNALHSFAHADGGYHLMGCILSAASCNKWWSEEVLHTTDYAAEQTPITADKLGANDVYFLPYLMGERSPHNDPASRGAFVGLRMDTPRAALTQAVLEGVAFAIRDCVEIARAQGVKIKASTLCGGGAKSPLWREILANVLGIPLTLPQTEPKRKFWPPWQTPRCPQLRIMWPRTQPCRNCPPPSKCRSIFSAACPANWAGATVTTPI